MTTVRELIQELQALPSEAQDYHVYIYADHGQLTTMYSTLSVLRVAKGEGKAYSIDDSISDEEVEEGFEHDDFDYIVEIGAP